MRSMVATQISNIQQLDIDSFQILTSTEDAKEVATAMAGGSETMEKVLINIATQVLVMWASGDSGQCQRIGDAWRPRASGTT